jgi:hypothetical protein
VDVLVDIAAGEVTVETRADKVEAQQLLDRVNRTSDSAHSFKTKLKKEPVRKGG